MGLKVFSTKKVVAGLDRVKLQTPPFNPALIHKFQAIRVPTKNFHANIKTVYNFDTMSENL